MQYIKKRTQHKGPATSCTVYISHAWLQLHNHHWSSAEKSQYMKVLGEDPDWIKTFIVPRLQFI